MRKILKFLKRIWIFNFVRRTFSASKGLYKKSFQILKWGFKSREDTNFTYNLSGDNIIYLAHTISVITKTEIQQVLKYINEANNDNVLKDCIKEAIKKSDFRKFADTEVRFGRRLGWYAFVRILKPEIVIETGIDKGLGAILLCSALKKNKEEGFSGRYYGTDINPSAGYFLNGIYKEFGEILYGDSIESLSKFNQKIDLFINDSDHSVDYEYREYQTIKNLLTEKTIILGDNSHCSNKLAVFSAENNRKFLFFKEVPLDHWYEGAGIGISYI